MMSDATPDPARRTRSRAKSAERWNRILQEATRLFRAQGFAATSMQEVSDAVGLLKGSLYYYVKSKEDLLVAILHDLHHRGEEIIAEVDCASPDPLGELERYLTKLTIYAAENADRLGIFFRDFRFVPPDQQGTIISTRDMYRETAEELIGRAIAAGQVPGSVNPSIASRTVLDGASGTHEWYRKGGSLSLVSVAEQIAGLLVAGLAHHREKAQ
jgi:TetR/AcrR family transcriptional regulator, cholesterol catabolism regulator